MKSPVYKEIEFSMFLLRLSVKSKFLIINCWYLYFKSVLWFSEQLPGETHALVGWFVFDLVPSLPFIIGCFNSVKTFC